MTVAWKPDRRKLKWAGVGVVAIAVFGLLLWFAAGFASTNLRADNSGAQVPATVTTMAPCNGASAQDTVSFTTGGQKHQAKLDSCGDSVGQTMSVLVPAGFADGNLVEPAAAAPGDAAGLLRRVSFVMLALVAVISGGAVYYFFSRSGGARLPSLPTGARRTAATPDPEPGSPGAPGEPDRPAKPRKPKKIKALKGRPKKGRPDRDDDEDDIGPLSSPFPRVDRVEGTGMDSSAFTETAEVNWFEDSATDLPVDLSEDLGERADRS